MQMVILAAGKGIRMLPITKEIPKPMVPLKGKPKLQWTMEMLPEEIDEVVIVVGHLGGQIKQYFGDSFGGRKISYVFQQELNGTGGALHACKDIVGENFLVMMGDDLYHKEDVREMANSGLAILVKEVQGVSRLGSVLLDSQGNFCGIIENKKDVLPGEKQLVNAALYALDRSFFGHELVSISDSEFGLPQTIVKMLKNRKIKIVKARKWVPLASVEDIEVAEKQLDGFLD